ncbi:DUF5333 domain-containing protein [Paracoccus cavernae]|uniref:DUF5333 domain-containing protein n=1 Tax=Paracoccus cavernae TaxID=1571207 RepID=UPI00362DF87A
MKGENHHVCDENPFAAAVAASTLVAVPAFAQQAPLSQEKYINDRLIAARIADRVRRECPTYGARMVYAWGQARALKRYALGKGYSEAQIDAFLDSKEDKKRIYAVAEDYLKRKGAKRAMRKASARSAIRNSPANPISQPFW